MKRLAAFLAVGAVMALTPAALAGGTLSGTYMTTISGDSSLGGGLNGIWVIKLTKGHYKVTNNGKAAVSGKDTIKGHKITFHDKSGPDKCPSTGEVQVQADREQADVHRDQRFQPRLHRAQGRADATARFTKV
jgi:hypothetical protein